MSTKNIQVIDLCGNVVAAAEVAERGEHYVGVIDLSAMPARLRQKFEEYEEIVNGQMFSLLDEIEEQISNLSFKVVFETGRQVAVEDLQIFPTTRRVSFKIAKEPARGPALA